jgi:hypothetical protein
MLQEARLKEVDETSVSTNLQNGLVDGRLNSSATRRKQAEKNPVGHLSRQELRRPQQQWRERKSTKTESLRIMIHTRATQQPGPFER